jgi:nucleoside-diphosphate-sugar epimerase
VRIFVTGATGFIGAHFVEHALTAGHEVIGLHRSKRVDSGQIAALLQRRGAQLIRGDILDPASFQEALGGVDCVCHFAGAFREADADERYFERTNVEGAASVLRAAAANGVRRFVHCSTAGIYGQRVSGVVDESTPIRPWNSYERSKLAAEAAVRRAAKEAGMEYVILRPSAVYGPRDERLRKLFRAVAKGRFPLFGRGEGRRHMIYVTDLVDAFLRACSAPSARNQELIVAGPRAATLREILETAARAAQRRAFGPVLPLKPMLALAGVVEDACAKLNWRPPIYRRRMDFYLNDAAFDSSRAQQLLGWRPRVDLLEGFSATLAAEREPHSVSHSAARIVVLAALSLFTSLDGLACADAAPFANALLCSPM